MPRYIDAEPIEQFITDGLNNKEKPFGWIGVEILTEVKYAPTADVTPIVHAHWILKAKISENCFRYNCSHCNRWVQAGAKENPAERFPYCHCGAKMDKEVEQ